MGVEAEGGSVAVVELVGDGVEVGLVAGDDRVLGQEPPDAAEYHPQPAAESPLNPPLTSPTQSVRVASLRRR